MRRSVWMVVVVVATMGLVACGGGDDVGDVIEAEMAFWDTADEIYCECYWEEEGFESEQECLDFWAIDDADRSEAVQCANDSMADVEMSTPESVEEYFSCVTAGYDEAISCLNGVDNACGESGMVELEDCIDDMDSALDSCEDDIRGDDDADDWFEEFEEAVENNNCEI